MLISGEGGALPSCATSLRRASPPEGKRMSFCDQMTAAIDGARTLTRLDHLSRSIWQGLAAGAVGDDDAQSLAERLHARRSVLRGEIKPVSLSSRPTVDLPAQEAATGTPAPCRDCPTPSPCRLGSDAAWAGLQVHGQ